MTWRPDFNPRRKLVQQHARTNLHSSRRQQDSLARLGVRLVFTCWTRKVPTHDFYSNGTGDAKKNPVETGKLAIRAGLRHIDTAQGYDNEKETGAVVSAVSLARDEIFVTSKCTPVAEPRDLDLTTDRDTLSVAGERGDGQGPGTGVRYPQASGGDDGAAGHRARSVLDP